MLIGNYSVLQKTPNRLIAGSGAAAEWNVRSNFNKSGMAQNRSFQSDLNLTLKTYGRPTGYYPPYTWVIPAVRGEIGSINSIIGCGGIAPQLALAKSGAATLSGSGGITSATAQLVISMVAALAGSGTAASADLRAYLNAVASLQGSGAVTAAIGSTAWIQSVLNGAGAIHSATPFATGQLSATIRGYSDLTPEGLRDAVLNALLANYQTTGSAGKALASAGAGGVDYDALAAAVWERMLS